MPLRHFLRHASHAAKHQLAILSQPAHKVREKHVYRKKTLLQSAVVSLSSLLYLLPAYAYGKFSGSAFDWDWNDIGCVAYTLVALFSCLADGQWLGHLGLPVDHIHLCDRVIATLAGVYSIIPNLSPLRSPFRIVLTIFLFVVSSTPLHLSRSTPRNHVWEWVFYHSMWHLFSAVSLSYLGPFTSDDSFPVFFP